MSSAVIDPIDPYVEAAEAAGAVFRDSGMLFVGDAYDDPLTGRRQCLVEYLSPEEGEDLGHSLREAARRQWPDAEEILVRTSQPLGQAYEPLLTYLRASGGDIPTVSPPPGVAIRPSEERDRAAVVAMLRDAFERACTERNVTPLPERIEEAAAQIINAQDRMTFVAQRDGKVVAHATMLTDARDEPSGEAFVELIDVLVGEHADAPAGTVQAALVSACGAFAATLDRPLLGHVVHELGDPARSVRVVERLLQQGWQIAHRYQVACLADTQASPLRPPRAWDDPERHLRAASSAWYRMCTRLTTALVHATHDFYRARSIDPVLMPVTVSSVSSPMGLGSDSLPVKVALHDEPTYLADSMQFQLEFMLRHGLRGAYYVMPTFRGEDPDATHLNQFFHSEAEIGGDLDAVMRLVEDYVGALVAALLDDTCTEEVERAAGSVAHLESLAGCGDIPRVTFDDALGLLGPSAFEDIGGGQLGIRRVAEQELIRRYGGAVWLTHPPHLSVPFYQAFDAEQRNALSADLLLGIGEVAGCGQRHTDATSLRRALALHRVAEEDYRWYVEMKRDHPMCTSGFGLGIERFLLFVLRHDDIRDLHVMPRLKGVPSWL